jgi:hypothetical protein
MVLDRDDWTVSPEFNLYSPVTVLNAWLLVTEWGNCRRTPDYQLQLR